MSEATGVRQPSAGSRLRRQALGGDPDRPATAAGEAAGSPRGEEPQAGVV
ncbi:hypothetical protein ACIODT_17520 [Streptomyces sp. NPDC088251]